MAGQILASHPHRCPLFYREAGRTCDTIVIPYCITYRMVRSAVAMLSSDFRRGSTRLDVNVPAIRSGAVFNFSEVDPSRVLYGTPPTIFEPELSAPSQNCSSLS